MRRTFAAFVALLFVLSWMDEARAQPVLEAELSGGVGATLWNEATDSALSPPFVQLRGAYLPLRVGPLSMGPALSVPLGFYQPDGQEGWRPQVGMFLGWQVYSRPSVSWAWMVTAGGAVIISPLDDERDPVDAVVGFQLDGTIAYFLTAGFALTGAVEYAFFYGVDPVHSLAGRLGVMIAYEVFE